ncbi:hypothetical protein, partial [Winogradskya consettensis]|uniref:hypothetical protein n=1 Tax=Winogradskya consettensis TaxID=113560 RepID=UPI001BB322E8
ALAGGRGRTLEEALRDTAFTVTDDGAGIRIGGPRPDRDPDTFLTHYSAELPDDTAVFFLPLTDGIDVAGPAVEDAELAVRKAGAAGFEVETRILLEPPAGLSTERIWALGAVATSPNVKIVIDRARDGWIFEVVTAPAAVSVRETVGRVPVDDAIEDARRAVQALAGGRGRTLEEALRDTAFTVTDDGAGIRIGGPRPDRDPDTFLT